MTNQKHVFILFIVAITVAKCSQTISPISSELEETITFQEIEPDFGAEDPLRLEGHPWIGAIDAPVTIVKFLDFKSPSFRRQIHEILEIYPTQVRIVFKQIPRYNSSNIAAQAALAAHAQGNDFFWEYYDILFENRSALERADLEGYAEQIGLNMDVFREALDNETFVETIEADIEHFEELGIQRISHLLINGLEFLGYNRHEYANFQNIQHVIDAEYKMAQIILNDGVSFGEMFTMRVEINQQITEPNSLFYEVSQYHRRLDPDAELYVPIGESAFFGPTDALVTIVAFFDFQSLDCNHVLTTLEQVREEFGDNIRIVFKHFPSEFHERAEPAARASIAAQNQGQFWEMHDLLFANQQTLTDQEFNTFAEQLNLNLEQFNIDIHSKATTARLIEDRILASRIAVFGSPRFFVNGIRITGPQPFSRFQSLINEQLLIAQELIDNEVEQIEIYEALQADAIRGPVPITHPLLHVLGCSPPIIFSESAPDIEQLSSSCFNGDSNVCTELGLIFYKGALYEDQTIYTDHERAFRFF